MLRGHEDGGHLSVEVTAKIAGSTVLGTGLKVKACRRVMAVGQACCAHSTIVWVIALLIGDVPPGVIVYDGSISFVSVLESVLQVPGMPCNLRYK